MNAWEMSPVFGMRFIWVARASRMQSSNEDRTGAKQSAEDQECGSRLPRTTIRYLARLGLPSASGFIFDIWWAGHC